MRNAERLVVETAGLCKSFRDFWRRPQVEAVKDLNLNIERGEVFGLLGPNGSGKSTTIKMLLGLLYPTKGRIAVFGRPPTDVSVKARIGFLPEESYLYRFLVAHETLDYYGRLFRLPARVRRERAVRLLDMVGLQHEADRRIGEYSKGMARRIGLAQALINDPELLILDEPTAGLDPIGIKQIKDVIRELGRKGKTILLSSHVLADVEDVCDRVSILYGGQQMAAGDIGELLRQRDVTQFTTPALSDDTIAEVRRVIRRLEEKDVLQVTNPRDKLEDFFLRIVHDAQAANVVTSGARTGGAVPEFLGTGTDDTRSVVDSLVAAADTPRAIAPPATETPAPAPSSAVLDQLLSVTGPGDDTKAGDEARPDADGVEPPPASDTPPDRIPTPADRGVIDRLVGGREDGPEGA